MPTAPKPIAKVVRFRRSHFLVADIILFASPDLEQCEKGESARAFKEVLDVVGCSWSVVFGREVVSLFMWIIE